MTPPLVSLSPRPQESGCSDRPCLRRRADTPPVPFRIRDHDLLARIGELLDEFARGGARAGELDRQDADGSGHQLEREGQVRASSVGFAARPDRPGRSLIGWNDKGPTEVPARPLIFGAADRIRTGDVQPGNQAKHFTGFSPSILFAQFLKTPSKLSTAICRLLRGCGRTDGRNSAESSPRKTLGRSRHSRGGLRSGRGDAMNASRGSVSKTAHMGKAAAKDETPARPSADANRVGRSKPLLTSSARRLR